MPQGQARDIAGLLRESARNFVRLYAGASLDGHLWELLGAAHHEPELAEVLRDH